jgi:osmoprotectant transport system ATP-binding protein
LSRPPLEASRTGGLHPLDVIVRFPPLPRTIICAMRALLILQDVSKRYGQTPVLARTSLSAEEGLTTVLIGPSGCGKSTILRLIVGLATPDSGHMFFAGQEINPLNVAHLRSRIGYVIQEGGLFPHLTARDNVLLMARYLKKPGTETEPRLKELCELTQLDRSVLQRYPAELSGGQRQRIGLMRALMLSPQLLLLDEPLGALDPLVRYALQRDLKEIFQRLKQTTLIVTHDLAEAAYLGDTIILMNAGEIVQQGTLAELRTSPASPFVSDFIKAQRPLET